MRREVEEAVLHTLRDCAIVEQVWKRLMKPIFWQSFYSPTEYEVCVATNLIKDWGEYIQQGKWKSFYREAFALWKMRNSLVLLTY